MTAENVAITRQQILERLVDQQIIIEKANKESLDRTPEVLMAIEAAKKEILAKAYLQKMLANSSKINDTEVKKYYGENKGLFAKRRIYNLQDIATDNNIETLTLLKAAVSERKTMQEIAASLQQKGIKYAGNVYTRPAEQLPLDILPKLQALNEGETIIIEVENTSHVLHIAKIQEAPMDLATASPYIKSYFVNTRGKVFIEDKIKQFRKEAKIEYMGDFTPPANTTKDAQAKKDDKTSSISAGVAGLK